MLDWACLNEIPPAQDVSFYIQHASLNPMIIRQEIQNIKHKIKNTYDMKSPGRAHIRYSPYTRFHCTFYCFPPRMIQIEKFFGQQSFMWRDNKQFQNYIHTKFIFAYMLIKRPECWYIRIWFLINKEDLNLNQFFF